MPITKSAIKKLRSDKKRTLSNRAVKSNLKLMLKKAQANLSLETVRQAVSALDKATKKGIIHQNAAARKKSRLAKKLALKKPTEAKIKKITAKKKAKVAKKSKA